MAYTKILIDNLHCSRRFHVSFDDESAKVPRVELRCQLCQAIVFSADNHAPAQIVREENLVKTAELSENLMNTCDFEDVLSQRTIKNYPVEKLYQPSDKI